MSVKKHCETLQKTADMSYQNATVCATPSHADVYIRAAVHYSWMATLLTVVQFVVDEVRKP
jgi:hypothetical protein